MAKGRMIQDQAPRHPVAQEKQGAGKQEARSLTSKETICKDLQSLVNNTTLLMLCP